MKILKKTVAVIIGLLVFVSLIVILFYRQEAYQLYKVLTLFDKEDISWNFRNMKDIFPSVKIPASDQPFSFPVDAQPISLPENFMFNGQSLQTQNFLDSTLTEALLVLKGDTLRYEYYSNGFKQNDVHISWSVSKSVLSALFGIAVHEGHIQSIEETVTDYLPEFKGTGYDGVRIKDVLQMSTGVGFNEDYGDFNSDINVMGRYFALGMPMADFAKRLEREREPGTYNHYVSINTQILGMILVKATGRSVTDYMTEKLWGPLGAQDDAWWIIDNSNMEFVIGGLNATARDYAKMGQLFLDSGRWNGKQIVPEEWVVASITPDAPHLMPGKRSSAMRKEGYGYQWWIPSGGNGEFDAQGIYGQFIYVDPDRDMVIVKLASNYHFKEDKVSYFLDREIALFCAIAESLGP